MHLITGKVGTDHITSANDGFKNAHVFGDGSFVFNEGGSFTATKIDNNTVRIGKGQGYIQGRLFEMTTYEEVNILSGTESFNRCDLIVARYEKDANTQLESIRLVVLAGERTTSGFVPPEYIEGDILAGDLIADFPLYQVEISGIEIQNIRPKFEIKDSIISQEVDDLSDAVDDLSDAVANKVDKVTGKGLSTNDYTTAEKNNLASIISKFTMSSYFSNLKLTNDYVTGRCFSFSVDVTDAGRSAGGQLSEVTKFSLNFTNSGITLEQLKNGTWSTLWSNH